MEAKGLRHSHLLYLLERSEFSKLHFEYYLNLCIYLTQVPPISQRIVILDFLDPRTISTWSTLEEWYLFFTVEDHKIFVICVICVYPYLLLGNFGWNQIWALQHEFCVFAMWPLVFGTWPFLFCIFVHLCIHKWILGTLP